MASMTPERRVKEQVKKQLKEFGQDIYYFFPATGGYGRNGVPDIIGCLKGNFFAIECKAGRGTTTALQDIEIAKIKQAGGSVWVLNEFTVQHLSMLLRSLQPNNEI
jgi:Holliday junction resolvase